jgi:hypothetical protein
MSQSFSLTLLFSGFFWIALLSIHPSSFLGMNFEWYVCCNGKYLMLRPSPQFACRQSHFRRSLRSVLAFVIGIFLFATLALSAQTSANRPGKTIMKPTATVSAPAAGVKSFRVVQEEDGSAVEILSTKPLIPTIQTVTNPDRLVIDLPNARIDPRQQKKVDVKADQIVSLRADQFQQNPPVARIVVDLVAPRASTWSSAGNRLLVRLGRSIEAKDSSPFSSPAAAPTLTPASHPVVTAIRAAGPLALSRNDGGNGSSITAGDDTAVLTLSSGGEVHVCPGTTLSVTPSQNKHNLMLSMSTGAMEAHLGIDASSDTVMTPDFRILLTGPGVFHYAFSADKQGNTCVRALPGNTASAVVAELFGDRSYQVKPTDQLVFRSGQIDRVDMNVPLECGCPPPSTNVLRATNNVSEQEQTTSANAAPTPNSSGGGAQLAQQTTPTSGVPASSPLEAAVAPNDLHVQVEAPLVFHASGPPPIPPVDANTFPMDTRAQSDPPLAPALPPDTNNTPANSHQQQPGFFKRLGSIFSALFHNN